MAHPDFHDPSVQLELLTHGTRDQLIEWLDWNDPNGVWTDRDSKAEGMRPLTLDKARAAMRKALSENRTPSGTNLTMLPDEADAATCREWFRLACRQFGLGFHPDTPASEYVSDDGTPLAPEVAAALDASIERCFAVLGDEEPYEVCMAEFQQMIATSSLDAYGRVR